MQDIVYKPFKVNPKYWNNENESRRDQKGREELLIRIGTKQIVDRTTGEILEELPLSEYVYKDLLIGIFRNFSNQSLSSDEYKVRVNVGCCPQLTITYENRLVIHNSTISAEVERISEYLENFEFTDIVDMIGNSSLNFRSKAKLTDEFKAFLATLNGNLGSNYSADFVGTVMREQFLEIRRDMTESENECHYMPYAETIQNICEALKKEDEDVLKTIGKELIYKLLLGDLVSAGSEL